MITARGFFAEDYWYWIAVVAMIGFILVYNFCFALSLAFLNREYFFYIFILKYHYKRSSHSVTFSVQFIAFGQSRSTVSTQTQSGTGAVELTSPGGGSNQKKKKGMILPFEPHCITFNDVKYSVDMPLVTC